MNRCLVSTVAVCALSVIATTPGAAAPTPPTDGSPPDELRPDPEPPETIELPAVREPELGQLEVMTEEISLAGSPRGVAEDFLVLPDGAELGGRLRVITADDGLGSGRIRLTDLALLDVDGRWAFTHGFEVDGTVSVLAKQPSAAHEHVWQGGSLTVRRDLWPRTAIAVSGSAGPLLQLKGFEVGTALFVTHRHRLNEIVAFALAGGTSFTFIRPTMPVDRPYLFEGAGHAAVQVGFDRIWGGWMGIGYALPVLHRGHDPVSGASLDPQPRLDLNIGNAVQLSDNWDLSVELTIIDRGDHTTPATHLPILDGGFDQIQLSVGVSRRIELSDRSRRSRGLGDPMISL